MISLADVRRAAEIVRGKVIKTPLIYSHTFSEMTGYDVYLKLENLQLAGSFKIRGATFKIRSHLNEIKDNGVIASSVGNHAQGVALAAQKAHVPATIIMPTWASIAKQQATKGYGAQLILDGQSLVESISIGQRMAAETNRVFIHPYDDEEIMTGQGTIGLEILEDLPDADYILVPVGGGGLIGGIAIASKSIRPEIHVIGVQASACPSAFKALQAGRPVDLEAEDETGAIADAIMVTRVGDATYPILKELVDEIAVVDDDRISQAVLLLLERKRILAEGAGAVPLAALLSGSLSIPKGSKVVLVISGGNVDSLLLDRIISSGLRRQGRLMRFSVCLKDVPGSLARLLDLLSRAGANVVHIHHARNQPDLAISYSRVELELETRGFGHIKEIERVLSDANYRIDVR